MNTGALIVRGFRGGLFPVLSSIFFSLCTRRTLGPCPFGKFPLKNFCNSAIPTTKRKPTAQLLNVAERLFLIDCGEGTQLQLRQYKIKMQRISHVFISHLHGDHYFGLIGLISTMHLLGREKELHIHGHPKLKEIINMQLDASNTILRYPIFFHPFRFDIPSVILEDDKLTIETIPLNHSIPCCPKGEPLPSYSIARLITVNFAYRLSARTPLKWSAIPCMRSSFFSVQNVVSSTGPLCSKSFPYKLIYLRIYGPAAMCCRCIRCMDGKTCDATSSFLLQSEP